MTRGAQNPVGLVGPSSLFYCTPLQCLWVRFQHAAHPPLCACDTSVPKKAWGRRPVRQTHPNHWGTVEPSRTRGIGRFSQQVKQGFSEGFQRNLGPCHHVRQPGLGSEMEWCWVAAQGPSEIQKIRFHRTTALDRPEEWRNSRKSPWITNFSDVRKKSKKVNQKHLGGHTLMKSPFGPRIRSPFGPGVSPISSEHLSRSLGVSFAAVRGWMKELFS